MGRAIADRHAGGLTMLHGRRSECEMLDRRLDALRGQSARPLYAAPLLVGE